MTHVIMVVRGGALRPADQDSHDLLAGLADGTEMIVDVHRPADPKWLRKWWAFMSILADNMPGLVDRRDKRAVSDMVLIAVRAANVRVWPNGSVTPVPHSLADMSQDARDRVWERAKAYVMAEWLPIGGEALEAEIDKFFHDEQASSLGPRMRRA